MKGNYLRGDVKQFLASITMRYAPIFEKFCQGMIEELQRP